MSDAKGPDSRPHQAPLRWQSQAVLLALIPFTAVWLTLEAGQLWYAHDRSLWIGAGLCLLLAGVVFAARAATSGAALTGALIAGALWLQTPGWHTALWPLLALLTLTFSATRFGRRRKESLGIAEGRRGRTAAQVAANLGVAALAGIPLSVAHVFTPAAFGGRAAMAARLTVMTAAMAEACADTLSSELGQVLGGTPRMITSLRRVPAGTDGAMSLAGTLAGAIGAAVVVGVALLALPQLSRVDAAVAWAAGIAGTVVDSLLGAGPERQGWLNNDAVNALSTLTAAVLAAWIVGRV
ncbi:MAG TPA: DUF92 domain-containing protein [Acidobacteriaceae bacterium]|nr:DUF92 domain-containing protein [Acidobacteriaceae bacterium]